MKSRWVLEHLDAWAQAGFTGQVAAHFNQGGVTTLKITPAASCPQEAAWRAAWQEEDEQQT